MSEERNDQISEQKTPAASPEAQPQHTPNGYVPGEPKDNFFAEQWRIIKERRALRKDMKAKGIKSRKDFEIVAESLGLVLWKGIPLFMWFHHLWGAIKMGFGIKYLLAAGVALLATLFAISTITEAKGSFTINLTGDMLDAGFVLSNRADLKEETSRLFSERLEEVTNITMSDIPADVNDIDGPHNGRHYVAYTFYIVNRGDQPEDYAWYLKMTSELLSVSDAVWLMLWEDDRQVIYAKAAPDGRAEELYGFREPPFMDAAYDPAQYYQKDGKYGVVTTPYVSDNIVAQGIVKDVQPDEAHKYTVVIWVEGHDPECTNDIFGGYAKYEMEFENVSEKEPGSIFDGLFRTEYEDFMNPAKPPEEDEETSP